jgi:hypothetical protein
MGGWDIFGLIVALIKELCGILAPSCFRYSGGLGPAPLEARHPWRKKMDPTDNPAIKSQERDKLTRSAGPNPPQQRKQDCVRGMSFPRRREPIFEVSQK